MFSALLGFALFVAAVVPLQAQYYGCNSSWALISDTGMYGGTVQPSVTTETSCRLLCYNNNSCIGVDWNTKNAVGNQCFLLTSPASTYTGSGINHWNYNRTAPCAGVCGSWSLAAGQGMYGGTQTNASSEEDCKDKCKNQNGCIGIDWNIKTRLCYLMYSVGQTYTSADVNHWTFNSTAGCISPCGTWNNTDNSGQYGGFVWTNVTNQDDCKKSCENNSTCSGIDWNINNPSGQQCFLLFGGGARYSGNGVTHWEFSRTGNCSATCASWMYWNSTGQYGGTVYSSATNQEDCKTTCERSSTCTGTDWNSNNPSGQQCFLLYGIGTRYTGNGVTHWEYNRNGSCQGSTMPTNMPTGSCNQWTYQTDSGQYGGTLYPSVANPDDCKTACISNASCTGVDWNSKNPSGQQCFLLFGSGTRYSGSGITHWEYNRNCAGAWTSGPSGGPTPGASQVSTAVTMNPGACFTLSPNMNIYGGVLTSASSPTDCGSACRAMTYDVCSGFDWDRAKSQCFLLNKTSGRNPAPGVDHYDRIQGC